MAITLVDVVVFLPMAMAGGLIGNILREFSLVVVFSTLMSLVVAFTLTPLLASRWGKLEHLTKDTLWGRISLAFESDHHRLAAVVWPHPGEGRSAHKRYILIGVLVLIVASFALVPTGFIGATFVPPRGPWRIHRAAGSRATSQPRTTDQLTHAGRAPHPGASRSGERLHQRGHPERTDGLAVRRGSSNANLSEINVKLVPKHDRKMTSEQFGNVIRDEVSEIPGVKVTVTQTSITGSAQTPIQIAVKGTDMDSLWKAARHGAHVVHPGHTRQRLRGSSAPRAPSPR
jgi:HAE1 family hydrophobic/amphiphilic exporter-1